MNKSILCFKCIVLLFVSLLSISCGHSGGNGHSGGVQASRLMYLQAVSADSVYVMAESQNTDPLTVHYGLTDSYGSSASTVSTMTTTDGTFIHRIPLTGLAQDTIYYYRLDFQRAGFRTAPSSGTPFRFAWMADFQSNSDIHDAIALLVQAAYPRFSLYGGDLCDDGTSYSNYKEKFFRPNQQALASRVPFFNATGNHEKWEINTKAFTQAPQSASVNQGYYSFDYGDLHVVVMNYMDPDGYAQGSPQYNFIAADLAAAAKPWKIVTCHSPAYVAGSHGENEDMIALTKNVFEPNGVDLVLSGHNHFYQRNYVNGIYHLVISSVGGDLRDPGPVGGYTQVSLKTHSWATFDLGPTTLQIHVFDEKGTEIDAMILSK